MKDIIFYKIYLLRVLNDFIIQGNLIKLILECILH